MENDTDFKEQEKFLLFYISAQRLKVNAVCMMGQGLSRYKYILT